MPSLLAELDSSMVARDPFPHIYVEGLLDNDLCRRLAEEILPPDKHTKGRTFSDDEKFYRPGTELVQDPEVSETWKRLILENMGANAFSWRKAVPCASVRGARVRAIASPTTSMTCSWKRSRSTSCR